MRRGRQVGRQTGNDKGEVIQNLANIQTKRIPIKKKQSILLKITSYAVNSTPCLLPYSEHSSSYTDVSSYTTCPVDGCRSRRGVRGLRRLLALPNLAQV